MKSVLKMFLVVFMLGLWFTPQANAVTAWYQPTPLPSPLPSGATEANNHIRDGWLGSYYNTTFVSNDEKWNIGGWGDEYRAYVKFDTEGLPKDVTLAALWLMPYAKGDASTPTWTEWNLVTGDWTTDMQWGGQPSATFLGYRIPPVTNQWYGTTITSWYNGWKSNPPSNYGLRIDPYQMNNNFNLFRSSEYKDFVADPYADGKRPILQLDFTPTLELKMPFESAYKWRVTTEIGGLGCQILHTGHQDPLYFSIDFSGRAKDSNGNIVYPNPATADIPILAAAGGTVISRGDSNNGFGQSVVLEHGTTGIRTRYSHMKSGSIPDGIQVNVTVPQGKRLGYMGDTATPGSVHLDFNLLSKEEDGVWRSIKNQALLAKVIMEGMLLKSYQVDNCYGPETGQRFYPSSNVMTP